MLQVPLVRLASLSFTDVGLAVRLVLERHQTTFEGASISPIRLTASPLLMAFSRCVAVPTGGRLVG